VGQPDFASSLWDYTYTKLIHETTRCIRRSAYENVLFLHITPKI